jgi:uncharacterized RDD family membrane protein YckC
MATGLDLIGDDKRLQDHWLRRFAASLIDWIIISLPFWVVFNMIGGRLWGFGIFMMGAAWILYSAVLEQHIGTTVGKSVMELGVMSQEPMESHAFQGQLESGHSNYGELAIDRSIIRNISKVHPVALLIDWLIGMVTPGDPRQRYLDRIAKTMVMHKSELKKVQHPHVAPPPAPETKPAPAPVKEPAKEPDPAQKPEPEAKPASVKEPSKKAGPAKAKRSAAKARMGGKNSPHPSTKKSAKSKE